MKQSRVNQLEAELETLRQELQAAHDKQRAGDEVFRRFSDSGLIGIALFELAGKVVYANEAFLKMVGAPTEELAAGTLRWEELTPPGWESRAAAALDELKEHGSCAAHEREYLRRDGTRFWGLLTGVSMPPHAVAFLLDVTERKKADEVLQFQARLLDAVEQAVIATDLEGQITSWNRFAERLYGWPAEEVMGRSILDVTPAEDHRSYAAAIMARLQAGESWSGELLVRRKDDSTFPAWVTESPIHDSGGVLIGVVGVSSDMTARKEALAREQEARARAEEAQRLHQAVEGKLTLLTEATGALIGSLTLDRVLDGILALSHRLVVADAYAIWRRQRGSGQWEIAAAEGLSRQYQRAVAETVRHSPGTLTVPMVVGDIEQEPRLAGHRRLLAEEGIRSMLVSPLLVPAAPAGTLVFYYRRSHTFNDIELKVSSALANLAASAIATTELYEAAQQRADQLAEADRLKDQFLAMLAHELRNPLGAISNAVQVTHRAPPGAPAFHRAQEVVARQSQHMKRLVDELLDVSRISRGMIGVHKERLECTRLVRDTCEDHRRILEAAGLSLSVDLPEVSLWVEGDPTRLRQAIGNLLQNAAKFTPAGGKVRVRGWGLGVGGSAPEIPTPSTENRTPCVVLTVSDTGIGIPRELLPRLFEPFVQADRSLDRTQGGLGLGLALVKGIVDLHGGRVHARSEGTGCGATFTIELPIVDCPDGLAADAGPTVCEIGNPESKRPDPPPCVAAPGTHSVGGFPSLRSPARTPKSVRVLVIEDNVDAAETLRDLLEIYGYQVSLAPSGPVGVEVARRDRPDIVLCDLGLPGMDGYAVAAALRREPATAAARLIALSGYGQEEDRQRSAAAGFDAHLVKPVDAALLQSLLAGVR